MIPVTKTFFPPITEYQQIIGRIWENEWLTNRGELVRELEFKLKEALKVSNVVLTTNGTLPIQIALKVLAGNGEVITTPFSYVATTSSIAWENCTPVFVDIDPEHLTIDEHKIEAAITERTTAILATHVFGNPCNIEVIQEIARKHNLKVIYDAAHCFNVTYKEKSIFEYGDVSTCSFHATKLFHTGEGGAFFCNDADLNHKLYYSHNFGHNGPESFWGVGINAKMSELQAAMGLAVLPHMQEIKEKRKKVVDFYHENLDFSRLRKLKIREGVKWNYSYFPVIFPSEEDLLETRERLNKKEIFPRRYFYPSLSTLNYVSGKSMPIAEEIAPKILCLPVYDRLSQADLEMICRTIQG